MNDKSELQAAELNYSMQTSIEELKFLNDERNTIDFKSMFTFLSVHNGWRNGEIHTIMGVAHGGKTTFLRSLLLDVLANNLNKKIGIWLSEEKTSDLKVELSKIKKMPISYYDRIFCRSNLENNGEDTLNHIRIFLEATKPDILFMDNISTWPLYEGLKPGHQAKIIFQIKELADKLNIPIVIIVHTGSSYKVSSDRQIENDDIFGSRSLNRLANFFYTLQAFYIGDERKDMVRIDKHRGFQVKDKRYVLVYHKEASVYLKDSPIEFNWLKENWKNRDRL